MWSRILITDGKSSSSETKNEAIQYIAIIAVYTLMS